jgi:hypothetical protein
MNWDANLNTIATDEYRARQYRERAVELRAVAAWMKEPPAIAQILATAREYERMAESIEKFGASKAMLSRVSAK